MNLMTLKAKKKTDKETKAESGRGLGLGGVQTSEIQALGREGGETPPASSLAWYQALMETTGSIYRTLTECQALISSSQVTDAGQRSLYSKLQGSRGRKPSLSIWVISLSNLKSDEHIFILQEHQWWHNQRSIIKENVNKSETTNNVIICMPYVKYKIGKYLNKRL